MNIILELSFRDDIHWQYDLILDTGSEKIASIKRCARALAPRMVQTTIADYVRLKRWAYMPHLVNYRQMPAMVRAVPVGHGFINLDSFFKGLHEGGFDGPVAYEICSPLRGGGSEDNLDTTAKQSLNQISALINGSA